MAMKDRALFCDANGRVVNGDGVLLAAARDLHAQGKLKGRHRGVDHDVEYGGWRLR